MTLLHSKANGSFTIPFAHISPLNILVTRLQELMKLLLVSHIAKDQLSLVRHCNALGGFNLCLAMDMEQALQGCKLNRYDILLVEAELPGLDMRQLLSATSAPMVFLGDQNALKQLSLPGEYILRSIEKPIKAEALQKLKFPEQSSEASASEEAKLDFSHIERLTRGKVELKMDLMEIFIEVVGEETEKVEVALPIADWVQISSSMHRMKSNLRMFGCMQVVEVVGAIENYARNTIELESCQEAIIAVMPQLKKLLNSVKGEMARLN